MKVDLKFFKRTVAELNRATEEFFASYEKVARRLEYMKDLTIFTIAGSFFGVISGSIIASTNMVNGPFAPIVFTGAVGSCTTAGHLLGRRMSNTIPMSEPAVSHLKCTT